MRVKGSVGATVKERVKKRVLGCEGESEEEGVGV